MGKEEKEKEFIAHIVLDGDQWAWYLARAGFGQEKRAEYIQRIPRIIEGLEVDNERLRNNIKELTTKIEEYMEIKCKLLRIMDGENIIITGLEEDRERLKNNIKDLATTIKEYTEIKECQELIADFKYTGKEGIILNQKKEISELSKTVMKLEGEKVKLKEEIKRLKVDSRGLEFIQPDDPSYNKLKKLYEKTSKEENEVTALKARIIELINENEKLKETIEHLKKDCEEIRQEYMKLREKIKELKEYYKNDLYRLK